MSLQRYLDRLRESAEYSRLLSAIDEDRGPFWLEGLAGTAKTAVLAGLTRHAGRAVLLLTATEEHAERVVADLPAFGCLPEEIGFYPETDADETELLVGAGPVASSLDPERRALARSRLSVLQALSERRLRVVVASARTASRATIGPIAALSIGIRIGETLSLTDLARRLADLAYERVPLVEEPGQFAVRGGLVDIWPSTARLPVRIELFGDDVESIRVFEPHSQLSGSRLDDVAIIPAAEALAGQESVSTIRTLLDHIPPGSVVVLDEPGQMRTLWEEDLQRRQDRGLALLAGRRAPDRPAAPAEIASLEPDEFFRRCAAHRLVLMTLLSHSIPWIRRQAEKIERGVLTSGVVDSVHSNLAELADRIRSWVGGGNQVFLATDQPHRLAELLLQEDLAIGVEEGFARRPGEEVAPEQPESLPDDKPGVPILAVHGRLSAGFRLPAIRLLVLSDREIFPDRSRGRRTGAADTRSRRFKDGRPLMSLLELREGDLVVHVAHGIGRYRGLVLRSFNGIDREFLQIDYQAPDRLFVPSDQLDRVQKYIGANGDAATIHRLGGAEWQRTKARVRGRIREMAKELIQLYAARKASPGFAFDPDSIWQEEMEASFPYRETRDQLQAIRDVKADMEAPRPMDRLVCGDVGYGKTEVAIRAAFKACQEGKQVAVLAPTTVLAQQHFHTFTERLAAFPVKLALLSRFQSRAELREALRGIRDGTVDIAIGTHRLLSKDVEFQDLGLLIVDEEQRFGVAHKERLKQLRTSVDALTLTATPIPRTLNMALAGLRDMSVIEEPPEGRLAVRTFCMEADDWIVKEAILRELDRGGQVYFLHNRVETIHRRADRLQRLVPQARIRVGHGQMRDAELEDVMLAFYEGEFDVLVCTTIIESGLDIPNVNTIIINDADRLGLAQLHQLRGRVGRSARQAYCYLLYRPQKSLTEQAEQRLAAIREFTELGAGFNLAMRDLEIRGAGNLLGAEQHGNLVSVGYDLFCQMIEEEVKALQGQQIEELLLPSVTLPISALIPEGYIPTDGLRIAFYRKLAACRTLEDVAGVQAELEDRFGDPPEQVWNLLALMRLRIECLAAGVSRVETDRGAIVLWMARRIDRDESRELMRASRRIQFGQGRLILYFDGENPLRPVQNVIKLLQKHSGADALRAVQRQLAAAEAAAVS